jgi:hypothetical protein
MIASRLADHPRGAARASHFVRTHTKPDAWFVVNSTNVDAIIAEPLPALERQIDNYLLWLATQVGDDHLAPVDVPDRDLIAGIVGAVDGSRVADLESIMERNGLIADELGGPLQLTDAGWRRITGSEPPASKILDPTVDHANGKKTQEAQSEVMPVIMAPCPECHALRKADVVTSHSEKDEDVASGVYSLDVVSILRCRGCSTVYVQRENYFSEDIDYTEDPITGEFESEWRPHTISYWPTTPTRKPPPWLHDIADEGVSELILEVYSAANSNLYTLATTGIRTVLDKLFDRAGADAGASFQEKLKYLVTKGTLSEREKADFEIVVDAGSAAAHRGWKPDYSQLDSLLSATENFIHSLLVQPESLASVRQAVPPRPVRRPKSP